MALGVVDILNVIKHTKKPKRVTAAPWEHSRRAILKSFVELLEEKRVTIPADALSLPEDEETEEGEEKKEDESNG